MPDFSVTHYKKAFYLLQAFTIGCLFYALYYGSRSFVLGYLVSIVFLVLIYMKPGKRRYAGLIGLLILTSSVFILIFQFKTDSSLGRMLIYKVSWNMFKDNFFSGIGLGKFELKYGLYQAAYFREEKNNLKELLIADNTYYSFNDYFQFIIETGLIGALTLTGGVCGIVYLIFNSLKRSHSILLYFAISQFIAISTAAVFTHVFEKLIFQWMFILALLIIFYFSGFIKKEVKFFVVSGAALSVLLCLWHYWPNVRHRTSYNNWKEASEMFKVGYKIKSLKIYDDTYPYLKQYPGFLEDYAIRLSESDRYNKQENILEQAVRMRTTSVYYSELGDCYTRNGNFKAAEAAYQLAIWIVPNRFSSRHALFLFYEKTKQEGKMYACGKKILLLPVKIPSIQVTTIKNNVKAKIDHKAID